MSGVRTALVVDDNELSAMFVALVLRGEVFEVRTATNGLHGYASYIREPTDWVVTDIQMPELDGVEMMRWIRSINPNVRTVYMSAATIEHQAALDRERQEFDAKVLPNPFPEMRCSMKSTIKSSLFVRERVSSAHARAAQARDRN